MVSFWARALVTLRVAPGLLIVNGGLLPNLLVLNDISKCLDTSKYTCYVDIEGSQTPAEGTLPPNVLVTNLKPDIVIMDKSKKTVSIFELTVPAEHRIKIAHDLKYQKYQHFLTDITTHTVNLVPFEVGSHTDIFLVKTKLTSIHFINVARRTFLSRSSHKTYKQ